jgi:hypothetical protein
MAKQALQSAQNALDSHSPSKEFEKLGMYSDQGFANGLKKFSNVVNSASGNVGSAAVNSLRDIISNIVDFVSGSMNVNPTIRPVLDLSSIKAGSKEMSSMFNNQTMSVDGRSSQLVGSIASIKNQQVVPSKTTDTSGQQSKEVNGVRNEFNVASLVVREEADINRIARKLYQLQIARGRG